VEETFSPTIEERYRKALLEGSSSEDDDTIQYFEDLPLTNPLYQLTMQNKASLEDRVKSVEKFRKKRNEHELKFICAILERAKAKDLNGVILTLQARGEQVLMADRIGWSSVKQIEEYRLLGLDNKVEKVIEDGISRIQTKTARKSAKGYKKSSDNSKCFNCGKYGHWANKCPNKK
jgi:F0F1-type ATP synthase delta subunit